MIKIYISTTTVSTTATIMATSAVFTSTTVTTVTTAVASTVTNPSSQPPTLATYDRIVGDGQLPTLRGERRVV